MNECCRTSGSRSWIVALTLAVFAGLAWSAAQEPPEVVWSATGMAADLPAQLGPGYTLFTIASDAGTEDSLILFRLNEGTTLEALQAASARIDQAFGEGGDVVEAVNEGLALVDVVAEVSAAPGESRSVGVVLSDGRYVLEYTPMADGPPERTYHEFSVEGEAGAPAPAADATVHLVDFAFAFPPDLPAGEQTWLVRNSGSQLHHMGVFTLAEGATLEDFIEFMEQMEQDGPPEPGDAEPGDAEPGDAEPGDAEPGDAEPLSQPVDYIGIMSAGQESYHFLDLAPGQYVAVCFLPDHLGDATGQPHFMLGMMQVFRVGEE
jgi:hypothetical protein